MFQSQNILNWKKEVSNLYDGTGAAATYNGAAATYSGAAATYNGAAATYMVTI